MTMSPGMQRKSIADSASVLSIVSAAGYVYYSGGNLNYSGGVISGVASYTWVQFNDVLFDLTIARYVHITDRHSTTDGTSTPGSLWWVDPTATAIRKRNLVSGPIYYATYAAAIADVPAASWPNMQICCNDVGNAKVVLMSKVSASSGSQRYMPENGRAFLFKNVYGTVASPTKVEPVPSTAWTFNIGTPTIPAALLEPLDSLYLKLRWILHGAGATCTLRVNLGTAGDGTDAAVYIQTATTDGIRVPGDMLVDISNATSCITNGSNGQSGGGSTTSFDDKTANFNVASVMKLSITGTKLNTQSVDLISYSVEWLAA